MVVKDRFFLWFCFWTTRSLPITTSNLLAPFKRVWVCVVFLWSSLRNHETRSRIQDRERFGYQERGGYVRCGCLLSERTRCPPSIKTSMETIAGRVKSHSSFLTLPGWPDREEAGGAGWRNVVLDFYCLDLDTLGRELHFLNRFRSVPFFSSDKSPFNEPSQVCRTYFFFLFFLFLLPKSRFKLE